MILDWDHTSSTPSFGNPTIVIGDAVVSLVGRRHMQEQVVTLIGGQPKDHLELERVTWSRYPEAVTRTSSFAPLSLTKKSASGVGRYSLELIHGRSIAGRPFQDPANHPKLDRNVRTS